MTTSLVIAIEPDREQAARLSAIVRARLGADLVLADSVARALTALGDRVPDLILTPALLSTRDEAALSARLRELGAAAAHVQTLTVPRIGGAAAGTKEGGLFGRFRRSRPAPAAADGCEPDVFAQQVSEYLLRARAERPTVATPPVEAPLVEALAIEAAAIEAPAIEAGAVEAPVLESAARETPAIFEAPPVAVDAITEEVIAEEPMPLPAAVDEAPLAPVFVEAVEPMPVVEDVIAVALLPVIEQMIVRPVIEEIPPPAVPAIDEIPAPAMLAAEEVAAPLVVDEVVLPPVTELEEIAVAPGMEVETPAVAPGLIEEVVAPPVIAKAFVPAAAPVEAIEEPALAAEVAVPVAAAPVPDEPQFSLEDLALAMWVAEEPEAAPIEAAVVPPTAPVDDDRFYIAAQDFGDVDISTLLEGLVLPDAPVAQAERPQPEAVTPPQAREPEPEPEAALAPLPSRRKLPPPRPIAATKAPRRRVKPPVQDEWGLFDPEQCGFAALLAKLDAVTEDEEMSKRRGTQTRVISYN